MDFLHIFVTGITFFAVLSILVLVHELGHFLAARAFGVGVEEFGLGLPPRIAGKKVGDVIYSINWLPLGGFVRLTGEDESQEAMSAVHEKESGNVARYFWARSKKERAGILLAGVAMNYLLSVLLTTFLLPQGYPVPSYHTFIESVAKRSPAEGAGLAENDQILAFQFESQGLPETKQITSAKDLIHTVNLHRGENITLTILRGGKKLLVSLVPRVTTREGEGPMGVAISDIEIKTSNFPQSIIEAVAIKKIELWYMLSKITQPLVKLITFQSVCGEVSGPIGIAKVTGQAVQIGLHAVLYLMSTISLNLAFLNVLPIPALDGGRLAFVILEKFRKRKVKPAFENSAHQIGFIILIAFMLLISVNDIFCPTPLQ